MNWFRRFFQRGPSEELARRLFQQQRERLELLYFQMASMSGKPRGLRWQAVDWEAGVEFARQRDSGKFAALVGVTIRFEAVEGGDMEGLPAVDTPRNASAVFFFHQGRWHTIGQTIFNLNPDEALVHFHKQYERLSSGG